VFDPPNNLSDTTWKDRPDDVGILRHPPEFFLEQTQRVRALGFLFASIAGSLEECILSGLKRCVAIPLCLDGSSELNH
jgi:hypothetical protein